MKQTVEKYDLVKVSQLYGFGYFYNEVLSNRITEDEDIYKLIVLNNDNSKVYLDIGIDIFNVVEKVKSDTDKLGLSPYDYLVISKLGNEYIINQFYNKTGINLSEDGVVIGKVIH